MRNVDTRIVPDHAQNHSLFKKFCRKCREVVNVTLAGACTVCGLVLGTPAASAQSQSGGTAVSVVLVTPGPVASPGGYPLGSVDDFGDSPHRPDPDQTSDGPKAEYATTTTMTRLSALRLLDSKKIAKH